MTNPVIIPQNCIPESLILNPSSLILHCCCAPCSGGIITALINSGIQPTVLFYNPNIHPEEEYLKRKYALTDFLKKETIPFVDSDYDPAPWLNATAGMEEEPQRGKRCGTCFQVRLEYSAKFSQDNGFKIFTSSFGISRWKDIDQVNQAGKIAGEKYGILYWDYNWRKNGGQDLMRAVTRQENFYEQKYCGCRYSLNQ